MDRKLTEADHQTLVVCWAKKICIAGRVELDLLLHVPNGEKRDAATASKLKRLGVRKGVSDLFLPVMVGGYGGLWIEMKADGGKLSAEQEGWIASMCERGYRAVACWSWQEAIACPEVDMETMAARLVK